MTNLIGQLLMVLAVNVTTNTVQYTEYREVPAAILIGHGSAEQAGVGLESTGAVTNVPASITTEIRIGDANNNYMFSTWHTDTVGNDLPYPQWLCVTVFPGGYTGTGVHRKDSPQLTTKGRSAK